MARHTGFVEPGPPINDLFSLARWVADRCVAEEAAVRDLREMQLPELTMETVHELIEPLYRQVDKDPDHGYYCARLTLAWAEAGTDRTRQSPWWMAADLFVDVTRASLEAVPDGKRLMAAFDVAQQQVKTLTANIARLSRLRRYLSRGTREQLAAERAELADTFQGLGWLLASPYTLALDPADIGDSFRCWLAPYELASTRFHTLTGDQLSPEVLPGSRQMPDPDKALTQALTYLNRAVELAPKRIRDACQIKRARVLALLAQVRRGAEMPRLLLNAADAVNDVRQPPERIDELASYLRALASVARYGGVAIPPRVRALIPGPTAELREKLPGDAALAILQSLVILVDPRDHQELWAEIHTVLSESGPLRVRPWFWVDLAHRTAGNRMPCVHPPRPLARMVSEVDAECARTGASAGVRAATLAHAALHARDEDLPESIELLEKIHEVDRTFADLHADMLDYLLIRMRQNRALELTEQGAHFDALVEFLGIAEPTARLASQYRQPGLSTSLVNRAIGVLERSGPSWQLAGALLHVAEPVVAGLIGAVHQRAEFVSGLGRYIMKHFIETRSGADFVSEHHLLFKGFDFRLLSQNSGPRPLSRYVLYLKDEIEARESKQGPYIPDRLGLFDDAPGMPGGTAALFFASESEIEPGQRIEPAIESLRRVADARITDDLIFETYWAPDVHLSRPGVLEVSDVIGTQTGHETVLISLYLGEGVRRDQDGHPGGQMSLVSCHVASGETSVQVVNLGLPGAYFSVSDESGAAVMMHWAAFPVAEIREEINADPLSYPITLRGAQLLTDRYLTLGGPAADALARWYGEGRRHLCFWPHGPLHFAPFHLLHVNGRPLADDWIVTTVSSSAQLHPRTRNGDRNGGMLIIGSPSGDPRFGLPEQPQVTEHVRRLHSRMPGSRLIENATRGAFLHSVRDVEYLHIAAHGSHDVEAPWYQCLFLSPGDDGGEGRVFAHEILALDLRGIELITLSACESALGRYDSNDNHRGLPAAFLLAGAATVIGALWPVTAPVASLFFEELYLLLGTGESKRDAYYQAQQTTRRSFPQYRDWGAFVLIGDWH